MPVFPACRWLTLCLLVCAAPAHAYAQTEARIWGEVTTADGDRYEGFIRWDRNEGGWADLLDGSKEIPEEAYEDWLQALRGGERPTRSIDLMGYRITWNEEDPDFPSEVLSGIRFGHVYPKERDILSSQANWLVECYAWLLSRRWFASSPLLSSLDYAYSPAGQFPVGRRRLLAWVWWR